MEFKKEDLLEELTKITQTNIDYIKNINTKSYKILNYKATQKTWSILECIEHLNRYGNFYIPEIKKSISNANTSSEVYFKSGLLGNYFAKSMLPKKNLNKMKTFRDKNPNGSNLDKKVIETFLIQQKEILKLLEQAKVINLTKTKTSISISKWIKFRLGDTFRFFIYHNLRHIKQVENIVLEANFTSPSKTHPLR